MKRIISIIMAVIFTTSIFTTTVFANSCKQKGKVQVPVLVAKKVNFIPPGIAKKIFDDIDDVKWAKKAIELLNLKGLVKGCGNGKFAPNNTVTKIETIIMTVRIMGWEKEVKDAKKLPKVFNGKGVPDWAKGYVTVAYEKGILDDVDAMYFKPAQPIQRFEAAKYIIRAMGYEDEARRHMDENLPFSDAVLVPQGAVGYVYLANSMKLMQGNGNGAFNPMGTLTRAEMAVLFHRLDGKVDSDADEDEVKGQIRRISGDKITLKVDGAEKTFELADDVVTYDGDVRIPHSELETGDKVVLELENGEAVSITVVDENDDDDKIITRYSGTVADIVKTGSRSVAVQSGYMKITFVPTSDVRVYFKREQGSFDGIKTGDDVTVVVDTNNRAREIYVNREIEKDTVKTVKGFITTIDLSGTYHLTIDGSRYVLSKEADVTMAVYGEEELKDLRIGYYVECSVVNDIITEIYAEKKYDEFTGEITDIDTDTIEVTAGSTEKRYRYANTFLVYINGESRSHSDLREGMDARLMVLNDVVYQIHAEE